MLMIMMIICPIAASTLPRATPGAQGRPEGQQREKVTSETQYATVRRSTESKGTGTSEFDTVISSSGAQSRGRSIGRQNGREIVASKSVDYSDAVEVSRGTIDRKKNRSKSTDDVTAAEREQRPARHDQAQQMSSKEVMTATRRLATQQQQTELTSAVTVQSQYSTM